MSIHQYHHQINYHQGAVRMFLFGEIRFLAAAFDLHIWVLFHVEGLLHHFLCVVDRRLLQQPYIFLVRKRTPTFPPLSSSSASVTFFTKLSSCLSSPSNFNPILARSSDSCISPSQRHLDLLNFKSSASYSYRQDLLSMT